MYVTCQFCGQVFTRKYRKKHLARCTDASDLDRFVFKRTGKWPRRGYPIAKHIIELWEVQDGKKAIQEGD